MVIQATCLWLRVTNSQKRAYYLKRNRIYMLGRQNQMSVRSSCHWEQALQTRPAACYLRPTFLNRMQKGSGKADELSKWVRAAAWSGSTVRGESAASSQSHCTWLPQAWPQMDLSWILSWGQKQQQCLRHARLPPQPGSKNCLHCFQTYPETPASTAAPQAAVVCGNGEQSLHTDLEARLLNVRCIKSPLTISTWILKWRSVDGCFPGSLPLRSPMSFPNSQLITETGGSHGTGGGAANMWAFHRSHPVEKWDRKNTTEKPN